MGATPRRALSARALVVSLALLTPLLLAADPGGRSPPVAVYGVELDAQSGSERVLVFGKAPLAGRLEPRDAKTLVVVIPGAVLDASAPARVTGAPGAAIRSVELSEAAGDAGPEVRLVIAHAPGLPIEIGSRGATLAIELARPAPAAPPGIPMQYRETELAQIVDELARATGQRFIYDENLRGRITITSAERVSPEAALELLHSALLLAGFVALPTPSGARKILPLAAGGLGQTPLEAQAPSADSEKQTVTLVRLRSAAPQQVVTLLQPWLGATTLAVAHDPSHALILAGSEARLRTLMTLVSEIDRASDEELVIRRLRHRSASDAASLLLAALGEKIGARPAVEAWPDERTGALVLRAPRDEMADARALLDEIDRPVKGSGGIRVHPLRHADPEALATLLQGLATGDTSPADVAPPALGAARGAAVAPALTGALSLAGREFGVAVFGPVHALVLRGDNETLNLLEELVDELDRPPPMVEVEVIVLQILNDHSLDLGFDAFIPATRPKNPHDWFVSTLLNPSGGGLLQPGEGTGPAYAARFTRAPLVIPIIDSMGNPASLIVPRETAVITANDGLVSARTLMRPHLRMVAGDEQEIFAGNNIPIPVAQTAAAEPVGGQQFQVSQNIERQDVGITLRVKPTLGEAGNVKLELNLDVSAIAPSLAGDVEEVGPSFRNRQLTSTVYLNDDEFIVVGFAREAAYQESVVGTPWFMNIPILGWAFKTVSNTDVTARLVIAAQARIERSEDERIADSIRQRLAFERSRSRSASLGADAGTSWALLVAATPGESEADAIAARVSTGARPARVTRWESSGGPVFDVTVAGFATIADANRAAFELRDEGFDPEILVAPFEAH